MGKYHIDKKQETLNLNLTVKYLLQIYVYCHFKKSPPLKKLHPILRQL